MSSPERIKRKLINYLKGQYYNSESKLYLVNKKEFEKIIRRNSSFATKNEKVDLLKLSEILDELEATYALRKTYREYLKNRLYQDLLRSSGDPTVVNVLDKPRDIEVYRDYRSGINLRPNSYYQADLADLGNLIDRSQPPHSAASKKKKSHPGYILVVVDGYSNFIYAKYIENKDGSVVAKATYDIFTEEIPETKLKRFIQTDCGREFYNSEFKNTLQRLNVELYSTKSTQKAFLAERMIREIKRNLNRLRRTNVDGILTNIVSDLKAVVRKKNNSIDVESNATPADLNVVLDDDVESGRSNPSTEYEKKIIVNRTEVDARRNSRKLKKVKNQYFNKNLKVPNRLNVVKKITTGTRVYLPKWRKLGKSSAAADNPFIKASTVKDNEWDTGKTYIVARVYRKLETGPNSFKTGRGEPFEYYKLKNVKNNETLDGFFYRNELFPANKSNLYKSADEYKRSFLEREFT